MWNIRNEMQRAHVVGPARSGLALQHPNKEQVGILPPHQGHKGFLPSSAATLYVASKEQGKKVREKPTGTFVIGTGTAPSVACKELMSQLWKEGQRGTAFIHYYRWHKYWTKKCSIPHLNQTWAILKHNSKYSVNGGSESTLWGSEGSVE